MGVEVIVGVGKGVAVSPSEGTFVGIMGVILGMGLARMLPTLPAFPVCKSTGMGVKVAGINWATWLAAAMAVLLLDGIGTVARASGIGILLLLVA